MSEDRLPCSRGRTLKVSMALATLGLVIFLRAATCGGVSGTAVSFALGSRGERRLDGGEIGRHGVKRARLVGGAGGLLEAMPGDDTDDEIGGADPAFAAKPGGGGGGGPAPRP